MWSGAMLEQDRSFLLHAGTRASVSAVLTVFLRREGNVARCSLENKGENAAPKDGATAFSTSGDV